MSRNRNDSADDGGFDELRAMIIEEVEANGSTDRYGWIRRYPEFASEISSLIDSLELFEPPGSRDMPTTEFYVPSAEPSPNSRVRPTHLRRQELHQGDLIAGQYKIKGEKSGGMGRVFFVQDVEAKRAGVDVTFAIKTVRDFAEWKAWRRQRGKKTADEEEHKRQSERFLAEAKTWVSLGKHDHIIHAIGVFEWGGKPYLLMEYANDGSLADMRERGVIDIPTAICLIRDVCLGMSHAYKSNGLVHRDLKPANILVDGTTAKVTDLGLARAMLSPTALDERTSSTEFDNDLSLLGGGTLPYMPQEQFHSLRAADTRSDIFAIGVVLFELVTSHRMFPQEGNANQYHARSEARPIAHEVNHAVPMALSQFITRCTEFSPDARFQSFDELVTALEAIACELDVRIVSGPQPSMKQEAALAEFHRPEVRLLQETYSLISLGEYEAAIDLADEAIALEPKNADHWINKGKALAEIEKYQDARDCFCKATQLRPADARAWANCAFATNCLGRPAEGLEFARGSILADREFADGWLAQGTCELDLGRQSAAVVSLNRAVQLAPHNWKALASLGACLGELDRHDEAVETLGQAISINPTAPAVHYRLAYSHLLLGQFQEARDIVAVAVDLDETSSDAWGLYGVIWWQGFEDLDQARTCFDRALTLDPGNLRIHRARDDMNAEQFHNRH